MIEITGNDDGTCGCGIPEHDANDIGKHDVQFGDPELMSGAYGKMTEEEKATAAAAEALNLRCPFCKTALVVSAHAFASGKVDRCTQCRGVNEDGDDIIAKQDEAEALAERNRKLLADGCGPIPYPHCPGCGIKLNITDCSVKDGLYHFGPGGCAEAVEPSKEFFPIEFELAGKEGIRHGVCQGTDAQDAIKNFLGEYPTSGDCGTIVAIRVPGVAN